MPAAKDSTNGLLTTFVQPAIDSARLPPGNDEDLVLEVAEPAEWEQSWRLNVAEWTGPLSETAYLDRERYLMSSSLTNKGQQTLWVLTSSKFPRTADGTRPILASCETLLKTAYIAKEGHCDSVLAHGIGSVYCRPEYRGKGYAGRMITMLGKKLETWQHPVDQKGSFSILYSDIGKKFYARHKWEPYPSDHITLPSLELSKNALSPEVQDLTTSDLASIPTTQYLLEILKQRSMEKPGVPHVAIRPDVAHFRWHHMREEFLCSAFGRPFPEVKGALHKPTGIAIIWHRIFNSKPAEDYLAVLLVVVPPAMKSSPRITEALTAVLLRAQREAFAWNLPGGVEIWNPPNAVVQAAQKLSREEDGKIEIISRDNDHICSLRWDGPEKEVVWVDNERYAWC